MSKKLLQKLVNAQNKINSGQLSDAINLLNKLLEISPQNIECLMLKAEALLRLELFSEALQEYAGIVQLAPKNVTALSNFSIALIRSSKYTEALEIINYVLELDENNFAAIINSCSVYQALGEYEKALLASLRAIKIDPKSAVSYLNLGTALAFQGREDDALQAFLLASTFDPTDIVIKINLAQLEESRGDRRSAIKTYEDLLHLNLTNAQAEVIKFYLSFSYLYFGNLIKGWEYYDFGFNATLPSSALRSVRKFNKPKWDGNLNVRGVILIWREQGLGDEIVFSTCLQDLHNLKMNIIVECDVRLVDILIRAYPNFKVRGESFDHSTFLPTFDDYDHHLPIGSLPRYFRNSMQEFNKVIPSWVPLSEYKNIVENKIQPYKQKILVGICWRSGLLNLMRNDNYTSLHDWKELLVDKNLQFVNLQYGECESEILEVEKLFNINILRWNDIDLKNDIESVLALCSQLDIICTVGTAVSSIAGASGTPTLLLVKNSWILLGEQQRYPWYQNVRPFVADNSEHVAINIKNLRHYIHK